MLLPRLAQTLARPRLALWLARHSRTALRLLIAPAGTGKTTAVVGFLRTCGVPFVYWVATAHATLDDLSADVAQTLGIEKPAGIDAFAEALRKYGPVQIAVENIDLGPPEFRECLVALVERAGDDTGFIYTSRSWNAIAAQRLNAHGLAVILDDRNLAFEPQEIAALAQLLGVAHTDADATKLYEESDGWAIVAAGAIREAFEHGRSLYGACDYWRKSQGYLFRHYLESSVEQVDAAVCEAWEQFVTNGELFSQGSAEQLRLAGLPILRDMHGTQYPYRVVEQLFHNTANATASVVDAKLQPLVVRVLGEFKASIGSQTVHWVRRRDQQIFLYLLLKEDGSATRLELCERFWPDAEPELRSASLRVACSNIRRALANTVGNTRVDNYFRSDGDIAVSFAHVTLDARRFRLHVREGAEQYARGSHQEAIAHYRMAESLYTGPVGWCAQVDDWVAEQAQTYRALYESVLERLVALHRRADDAAALEEFVAGAPEKLRSPRDLAKEPAC